MYLPLVELGEIGKIPHKGSEYKINHHLIDAGIKITEDDLLGIDYVIPDYSYIVDNIDRVKRSSLPTDTKTTSVGFFRTKQANVPYLRWTFGL